MSIYATYRRRKIVRSRHRPIHIKSVRFYRGPILRWCWRSIIHSDWPGDQQRSIHCGRRDYSRHRSREVERGRRWRLMRVMLSWLVIWKWKTAGIRDDDRRMATIVILLPRDETVGCLLAKPVEEGLRKPTNANFWESSIEVAPIPSASFVGVGVLKWMDLGVIGYFCGGVIGMITPYSLTVTISLLGRLSALSFRTDINN